jgi:eukaryotic-like serine/threonine-protein kinase
MHGQKKDAPDQDRGPVVPEGGSGSPADSQKAAQALTPPTLAEATAAVTAGAQLPGSQNVLGGKIVLRPGAVLGGRYEILQLLGAGGMGSVYKAKDRELDRFVALKVIRSELADQPEVLRRFKQELILAQQVTHKNVIRTFDLGEADGIKFISMDYIEGQDLRSFLKQKGKFTSQEATAIIVQVCQALEAAHSEGVVHRDLKPQNIMIDAQGKATVMDFGIAYSTELTGMTQTGALLGTPEYMSPEQAKGQKADARSDVFALGIIFYELLTGETPYKADTALATLLKRTQERVPPPSKLDPTIPRYLSDIVAKCLETDPRRRYQDVSEVLADLQAKSRPRTTAMRLRLPRFRIVEEHPTKWTAPALAVLLLAVGFVFRSKIFGPQIRPKSTAPAVSLAILPFRNASGDPGLDWLGPELSELLNTDVGQSPSLQTVASDRLRQILHDMQLTPNSNLDPATLRRLGELSNAQTLVWGKYDRLGDQIRINAALQDFQRNHTADLKAEALNTKGIPAAVDRLAQEIRENLAFSPSIVKELAAQAFKPSSQSLPALRDYNEGVRLLRQGSNLEAQKRFTAATQEDPRFALAYSKLAQTDSNLGEDSEADNASRKAVDLSEGLPAQEKYRVSAEHERVIKDYAKAIESYENLAKAAPGDADTQSALARLYEQTGSYDKAGDLYSKLLATDPKNAEVLFAMGRVEIYKDNTSAGLGYLNSALNLAIQWDNAEQEAAILQAVGVGYAILAKPDEALRSYQRSLEIKRRIGQKRGAAESLHSTAQLEDGRGKWDLALTHYKEALQLEREIGYNKGIGDTLMDLGNSYNDHGQYSQALSLLKEALQIERNIGDQNFMGLCLNSIGNTYFSGGDFDDARTYFEQALTIREKLKVPGDTADTLHNLAECELNVGNYDRALGSSMRALDIRRKSDDKRRGAIETYSIGTLFENQGRYGAAVTSKEEALKTFRNLGETSFWMAEILSGYGHALAEAGRSEEAQKSLDEALGVARDLKNDAMISQVLNFQGDAFFWRGDFKSARSAYNQALQAGSRSKDRSKVLLSRVNVTKVAVKEGRSREATSVLRGLGQEADTLGLKYLSMECSLYRAQALINGRDYARARQELEHDLANSEKLGLQMQTVKIHYLLGTALRLIGNAPEAAPHYATALSLLRNIQQEPGTENITDRSDVHAMYTESVRWAQTERR